MVNRGKPSLGCSACKERRVKCDLQKPSCKRCLRLDGTCPGYPSSWELVHRQQNTIAASQVESRVQKVQRKRQGCRDLSGSTILVLPLQKPIGSPATVGSVFKLYDDYLLNSSVAILEALPMLHSAKHASCLNHALDAAALASAAAQLHQSDVLVRARHSYGEAILTLRRSFQDTTSGSDDSVLASLFVLGLFEVLVQQMPQVQGQDTGCHPHAQGSLALLRSRVQRGLDTQLDQSLFIFCRHVQVMDIFLSQAHPTSLRAEFEDHWTAWPRFWPVDPIIHASVDLLTEMAHVDCSCRPGRDTLKLISQARTTLQELDLVVCTLVPESSSKSSSRFYFNGLLRNRCATSVAIAKSLFLTVRLLLVDRLSTWLKGRASEVNNDLSLAVFEWLSVEEEGSLQLLWEQISAALAAGERAKGVKGKEPGNAFRMFCLSWALRAVLQSAIASEQWKFRVTKLMFESG